MKLSKNFSLAEVIKSNTATRLGIDNNPINHPKGGVVINNLKNTVKNTAQKVRTALDAPVFISSGYRSIELNKAIGGSATSQHCLGQALDIDQDNTGSSVSNKDVFDYIKDNLSFDQLIWEFGDDKNPDWVHVSFVSKEENRNQVLVAKKRGGKTSYELFG